MPQSKTQTGKLNKKSKPISMLYPDPSYKQGHTKTQRVGGRLINQMESKKKAGVAILVSNKTDFKPTKIKGTKKGIA